MQPSVLETPESPRRIAISAELEDLSPLSVLEREALGRADSQLVVRADLVGDLEPAFLRQHFAGTLVYALRSCDHGGAAELAPHERRTRLVRAMNSYDIIDLEADRDLTPEVLDAVPAQRRQISWFGETSTVRCFERGLSKIGNVGARLYILSAPAARAEDGIAPLEFLQSARRCDVTAYAVESPGVWTRMLAPRFGAPIIIGTLGTSRAPDIPSIEQLMREYGYPEIREAEELFGIVGSSVLRSRSPSIHNRAYRALGIPGVYLPFQVKHFDTFWDATTAGARLSTLRLPLRGATVVSPHKECALRRGTRSSRAARRAASANSLVRAGSEWIADTSNVRGLLDAMSERWIDISGRTAAVVGCGGAGRAAAAALSERGVSTVLVNRTPDRGQQVADSLGLDFIPLSDFRADEFDLLVQATPSAEKTPFGNSTLRDDAVIVDMVYSSDRTATIELACSRGLVAIDGWEILAADAACQFHLMTGYRIPPELKNEIVFESRDQKPVGAGAGTNGPE